MGAERGAQACGAAPPVPDLSVVICTRDRPVQLRRALAGIAGQTHPGVIETVVVFDRSVPDPTLEVLGGRRPVRVLRNHRTPGLPGGRNVGVDACRAPLVGFCDDDDVWTADKAARQIAVLRSRPDVDVVVSGFTVACDGRTVARPLGRERITFDDLLRHRLTQANFGTTMVRREAFERIGPVDEQIPGGYAEDFEWLLRAARERPLAVVPAPLLRVEWHGGSFFSGRWQVIADALAYLVDAYPELRRAPRGLARLLGTRAFALAALGRRREAWECVRSTLHLWWGEPRAYLAAAVAGGVVRADAVVRALNRRGRGI